MTLFLPLARNRSSGALGPYVELWDRFSGETGSKPQKRATTTSVQYLLSQCSDQVVTPKAE